MKVTNARKFPDGSYVVDADNGFQKTFADRDGLLEWAVGPREEGWEALQTYIAQEVEINPDWDAVPNLKGGTVTAKVTATVTRDIN
jgi:hypothetical protein